MLYRWLSTLSFLTVVFLADFAAPLELWDDMMVKHAWHTAPVNWESLGHPPAGTIINLNIALKPERESALVDTLLEVSDPEHSRRVLLITPSLPTLFMCVAAPFQIWRTSFCRRS